MDFEIRVIIKLKLTLSEFGRPHVVKGGGGGGGRREMLETELILI